MKATIFAKKRKTQDGRSFVTYIGTITRKDGSSVRVNVKFKEDALPKDASFPGIFDIDKSGSNISEKQVMSKITGEIKTIYDLWVSKCTRIGDFVDTSLDDYE